jgi:thiol-disulfide isomerase/thioredoxin
MIRRAALPLALALLAGCGENVVGGEPVADAGGPPPTDGYPAGPYGTDEDSVLQDLTFAGYVKASPAGLTQDVAFDDEVSLADLRALGEARYLLLNVAAEWCVPCQQEAQVLPAKFERWAPAGALVVGVLTEDAQVQPASRARLDAWIRLYRSNFTMLHDPRGEVARVLAPSTMPVNLLIDLETMKIVRRRIGDDPGFFDFVDDRLGL